MGVAALLCFGWLEDGNCCCGVEVTTVPLLIGAIETFDGTAAADIGTVVDEGVGVGVVIFPGEGC